MAIWGHNQLNAVFNHAERYYGLTDDPVRRVDKIGSKRGCEMADFSELRDDVAADERLFAVTRHFLAHEMERG